MISKLWNEHHWARLSQSCIIMTEQAAYPHGRFWHFVIRTPQPFGEENSSINNAYTYKGALQHSLWSSLRNIAPPRLNVKFYHGGISFVLESNHRGHSKYSLLTKCVSESQTLLADSRCVAFNTTYNNLQCLVMLYLSMSIVRDFFNVATSSAISDRNLRILVCSYHTGGWGTFRN